MSAKVIYRAKCTKW